MGGIGFESEGVSTSGFSAGIGGGGEKSFDLVDSTGSSVWEAGGAT